MDLQIAEILTQDGITHGAIYMLLGLALVLVFSVTRVLFLPMGEYVTYGALGFALLLKGQLPGNAWLLMMMGVVTAICDVVTAPRHARPRALVSTMLRNVALPAAAVVLSAIAIRYDAPPAVKAALAIGLVAPLGPMLYRLGFMPVARASILTLMIIAVAMHYVLVGLSLIFFGAEGMRVPPLIDGSFAIGAMDITFHSLLVCSAALVVVVGLYLLFERTLQGKALRATAVSRNGARLVGIRTHTAGQLAFGLAAAIGALCGVLLVSLTTVYYDSGLAIGMRGFIGAVIGALVSFPVTAIGALLVGLVDSFAAFYASGLKDALLFLSIVPVLLYLSIRKINVHAQEDEE
jgi:branched-chain amino acid transport system permease protein